MRWARRISTGGAGRQRPAAILRAFGVALVCLCAASCAGPQATRSSGNKYGVKPSPKVVADGEPVPKGGGREMVGKPYVVAGQTFVPHAGPGYARQGVASWYGNAFHGRLTANGEVFDKESVAAAHPTLPLPSYVRVTNLESGSSMIVRVNDRGPYERSRLIDLSERAAKALAFHRAGTTRVRVEYVGRASVRGSDDAKLMATLRTDGSPAGMAPRPTILARLDERADSPAPTRLAAAERTKLPSEPSLALRKGDRLQAAEEVDEVAQSTLRSPPLETSTPDAPARLGVSTVSRVTIELTPPLRTLPRVASPTVGPTRLSTALPSAAADLSGIY